MYDNIKRWKENTLSVDKNTRSLHREIMPILLHNLQRDCARKSFFQMKLTA